MEGLKLEVAPAVSGRAAPALELQRWRISSRGFLLREKSATLVAFLCDCCLLHVIHLLRTGHC